MRRRSRFHLFRAYLTFFFFESYIFNEEMFNSNLEDLIGEIDFLSCAR